MNGMQRKTFLLSDRFLIPLCALLAAALIYMGIDVHNEEIRKETELKQVMEKGAAEIAARTEAEKERKLLAENDSFYQRLADGFPVKILVIGDSIGNGRGASDPDHTWQSLLEEEIEAQYGIEAEVISLAMNDSTAYSGYVNVMRLEEDTDPDLALVCFGADDRPANFAVYFESIIRALQARFPDCSVMTIAANAAGYYTENIRAVQELSEHYGIPCADTVAAAEADENGYEVLNDAIGYPTDEGQKLYARTIFDIIATEAGSRRGRDTAGIEARSENAELFETLAVYPVSKFTREGNTFVMEVPEGGISGRILGIEYDYVTGENNCVIFADSSWTVIGQSLFRNALTYGEEGLNNSYARHYRVVNNWITDWGTPTRQEIQAAETIRVVFPETEHGKLQADGFKSILLSSPR